MSLKGELQLPPEVFEPISIPGFSDPVSSLSHLFGAGVFAVLGVLLVHRGRGHGGRMAALGVFAFASVFLMSMSGVYHLLDPGGGGRAVLQRLDHSAIFLLIAATFTPVHAILFRGLLRGVPLFLIWLAGVFGITLKTIFFTDVPEFLGLVLYLGMGWLGLFSGSLVLWYHGWALVRPCLWGAFAYTAGAILEFLRWPVFVPGVVGAHELFHLAVLAGVGFHWYFVWTFADYPVAGAGRGTSVPPLAGGAAEGTDADVRVAVGSGCSWSPSQQFNSPRPPHSSHGRRTPPTQT